MVEPSVGAIIVPRFVVVVRSGAVAVSIEMRRWRMSTESILVGVARRIVAWAGTAPVVAVGAAGWKWRRTPVIVARMLRAIMIARGRVTIVVSLHVRVEVRRAWRGAGTSGALLGMVVGATVGIH